MVDEAVKPVSDAYAELFHYTTGEGLLGIVKSQQLRATHASFLSDAEEQIGFLDRRLPNLIRDAVRDAIAADRAASGPWLEQFGGSPEKAVTQAAIQLHRDIRAVTLTYDHPYVTSLCSAHSDFVAENGLLSQWRGYGVDGGYAIGFDPRKLEAMMREEVTNNFLFQFANMGDVEYCDGPDDEPRLPESRNDETAIRDSIRQFLLTGTQESLMNMATPVTRQCCLHKHPGFAEEREVRIVALLPHAELLQAERASGNTKPVKDVHFNVRNGLSIPHIFLLGPSSRDQARALPITKVIVGPHADKKRRRKAVEIMLRGHGIDAPVLESAIPYLGR